MLQYIGQHWDKTPNTSHVVMTYSIIDSGKYCKAVLIVCAVGQTCTYVFFF